MCYTTRGVYFDTDIQLIKNPEPFFRGSFCSSVESFWKDHDYIYDHVSDDGIDLNTHKKVGSIGLQAGIMYAEPHCPFIKEALERIYQNGQRAFLNSDGTNNGCIIDGLLLDLLSERGFKYNNQDQTLDGNINIYAYDVFATSETISKRTVAIHWYEQSWNKNMPFVTRLKLKIKSISLVRNLLWFLKPKIKSAFFPIILRG